MQYYIDYQNYKGGVNNLQVVNVTLDNGKSKTFTSTVKMAEKYAKSWIKNNSEESKHYFAGGVYQSRNGDLNSFEFDAVRATDSLPYVTTNKNGLQSASHHSSLYELSTDLTQAFLLHVRGEGLRNSPKLVRLPYKIQEEFKKVIRNNQFYN